MDGSERPPQILVGVGGSEASLAAARWAAGLARRTGARLRVVQVRQACPARAPYAGAGHHRHGASPGPLDSARLAELTRAALGQDSDLDVVIDQVDGIAERVLTSASADADLLVLGRGDGVHLGHRGPLALERPIGPVLRACLNHALCPVVVINVMAAARDDDDAGPFSITAILGHSQRIPSIAS